LRPIDRSNDHRYGVDKEICDKGGFAAKESASVVDIFERCKRIGLAAAQSSKPLDPAGKGKHVEINDLFHASRTTGQNKQPVHLVAARRCIKETKIPTSEIQRDPFIPFGSRLPSATHTFASIEDGEEVDDKNPKPAENDCVKRQIKQHRLRRYETPVIARIARTQIDSDNVDERVTIFQSVTRSSRNMDEAPHSPGVYFRCGNIFRRALNFSQSRGRRFDVQVLFGRSAD